MSFFSEQESGDLREAKAQIAELISRELTLREENARLRAEVKRLEELILDWESSDVVSRIDSEDALWAEAKRIRGEK